MTRFRSLKSEWLSYSQQWQNDAVNPTTQVIYDAFEELCQRYTQDNRHYHSLEHIKAMLDMARQQQTKIEDLSGMYFAIWFHDAVQGFGIDGETESAVLCEDYLKRISAPNKVISLSTNMILATRAHPCDATGDLALFLDLDLAILGARWPKYLEYSRATRREYPVPQWLYKRGRKKFLKSQLAKPKLFNTEIFAAQFEDQARKNLQQELLIL